MKIQELFNLKNNVAVITGGASHLGFSMSEALAEAGADVFIAGRNITKSKQAAERIKKNGARGNVEGVVMDIGSMTSVKNCFKHVLSEAGKIDILVNNAYYGKPGKFENVSEKDWLSTIDGTANGVFRCTQAIIPIMEKRKSGSVINISSMYGIVSPDPSIYENSGYDNPPSYGAGKAAIIQFTRYAACHLAKKGIRVNSVSPGAFPNPEVQKNRKFISNLQNKIPLGRIGKPDELKGVVLFLASKASSYVTGQNILVDGGWTAW